jgi:uncharacterized protein YabE (DUF348 family)
MLNITKEEIGKQVKKAVSLALMAAICTVSVASVGAFSRKVDITVDNSTISTVTINNDTVKILDQAGVNVFEDDVINRHEEVDGTIKLDVKRAFDITVVKGDKVVGLKKASGTVNDAISESGIKKDESDDINFNLNDDLEPNMAIVIRQRVKVKINADGQSKECFVPLVSVNDALSYAKLPLSSEDIINVDASSNVYEGMEITINRVTHRETVKTEEIPFKSTVKKTDLLENGSKKITTEGKKGQKEIKVKETLVDGNVVKSEELESKVISEPVDEMILEGTGRSSKATGSVSCESSKGERVIVGTATAYTSSGSARTSTGTMPSEGVTIAVNPKVIPYGSSVTVRAKDGSFKWNGIAQDTGGALVNSANHRNTVVDIYMSSKEKCIKFGRREVEVIVHTSK